MKKVYIFIDDISRSGGTERVATFLSNQMFLSGFSVTLISLASEGGNTYYPLQPGVKLEVLSESTLYELFLFLRKNSCDVLISVSMGSLSFKLACLHFLLRLKSRLILSEHVAFESSSKFIRSLKWLSYQFADDLVLLTKHDYKLLKSNVRAHTHVINNASGFEQLSESVLIQKQKIVLAVGRLTYQKGFDRLIRIWASISDNHGWVLRIVGDGELRSELQKMIVDLNVTHNVQLIPATKCIEQEYTNAAILAMTSRYEGLPLVLIEAKSFGLAAVAFDCKTGPAEIIHHKKDGFLITEDNEPEFSYRLQSLMIDDVYRNKIQSMALRNANDYSVEKISRQWLELIS
ncbi:glycosyltransferase family 4 protein [Escherichia coli]